MEPDSILLLTEQIISNRCGLHGLEFSDFSVNWIATLWIDKLLLKGSFKTFSLQYEISWIFSSCLKLWSLLRSKNSWLY